MSNQKQPFLTFQRFRLGFEIGFDFFSVTQLILQSRFYSPIMYICKYRYGYSCLKKEEKK